MSLPHETAAARVMVVGKDPIVTQTLRKLLELDEAIDVVGQAPTVAAAALPELRPDVIIVDENGQAGEAAAARQYVADVSPQSSVYVLDALRDLTVNEVLSTVRQLGPQKNNLDHSNRHLHAVAAAQEHDALASLSERELQVVRLVAEGLSNKEISARLTLSDKTVKNHISHILAKMGLTARTQVAVYAIRAGFV